MPINVASFIAYLLCDALGEKANEKLKEIFSNYAERESKDYRDLVVTIAFLMGLYDRERRRLKRKIKCIDFGEILGLEDHEELEVEANLLEDIIKRLEKYAIGMLYDALGGEEKLREEILRILSSLSINEIFSLISSIEAYRRSLPTVEAFSCIETSEGMLLGITFSSEELAERIEAIGRPTPIMYAYATAKSMLEGIKGVKPERIEREKNVIRVFFSFLRSELAAFIIESAYWAFIIKTSSSLAL